MEDNIVPSPPARQITFGGKVAAGILLVVFTLFSIVLLVAFWPDRLPEPGKKCALYRYDWFDMTLDTGACQPPVVRIDTIRTKGPVRALSVIVRDSAKTDTGRKAAAPVVTPDGKTASPASGKTAPPAGQTASPAGGKAITIDKKVTVATAGDTIREELIIRTSPDPGPPVEHIHINIIMLVLVAVAGFLGNMIHIATSFTTYVGAGKFQQSWILWYWVRPFTASALALTLYFAFGGASDPGNIDLDRTLTVAILTGLFTDIATQKLKEVFSVTFNPKDNRPDRLDDELKLEADSVQPDKWDKDKENKVTINGKKLTSKKLVIKVEQKVISKPSITDTEIAFAYTLTDEDKTKAALTLLITDEAGKELLKKAIPTGSADPATDTSNDTDDEEELPVG